MILAEIALDRDNTAPSVLITPLEEAPSLPLAPPLITPPTTLLSLTTQTNSTTSVNTPIPTNTPVTASLLGQAPTRRYGHSAHNAIAHPYKPHPHTPTHTRQPPTTPTQTLHTYPLTTPLSRTYLFRRVPIAFRQECMATLDEIYEDLMKVYTQ